MSLLVQSLQKTVRNYVELEKGYCYFQIEYEVLGPVSE